MKLYGKLAEKAESLDHLREIMYTLPKYIPISRMPPTSRAFRFHMLRTHLEVHTSRNLFQSLPPELFGFKRLDNEKLVPLITDLPSYLITPGVCT